MAKDNKQFILDIEKFVSKSNVSVNTFRAFFAYDVFERVINRTPIGFTFEPHSGTAKGNWTCGINTIPTSVLKLTDQTGESTKARMLKVLERVQGDDVIYLANSVPYIWNLEDGLYTKNPILGSWNRQTHSYEIRSAGGFSRQAPAGMVKLTLSEAPQLRKQALKKAQVLDA